MKIEVTDWMSSYYRTYVERDVRDFLAVGDLETLSRFIRLCAGRSGQILNLSSLGADAGVSHTTARRWISVLSASGLIYLLRPHHRSRQAPDSIGDQIGIHHCGGLLRAFRIPAGITWEQTEKWSFSVRRTRGLYP